MEVPLFGPVTIRVYPIFYLKIPPTIFNVLTERYHHHGIILSWKETCRTFNTPARNLISHWKSSYTARRELLLEVECQIVYSV